MGTHRREPHLRDWGRKGGERVGGREGYEFWLPIYFDGKKSNLS